MRYKRTIGVLLIFIGLMITSFALAGDHYQIDKAHTRVGFAVKHMLLSTVRGEFHDYDATIYFDEKDITKSSLEGTIKVASISTNNEKRDNHLRSPNFFDAARFPEIKFKSKEVVKQGNGYAMVGDLTIRDVTKEVTIPFKVLGVVQDPMGNTRLGVEAKFTINRKEFGVSWNRTMDNGGLVVSNDVTIEISFEGIKAE